MLSKLNYYSERIRYELKSRSSQKSKKTLFIHIPKSAGMTIRRSLKLANVIRPVELNDFTNKEYYTKLKAKMDQIGDHHGLEHARFKDLNQGATNNLKAFAVIRNPWDRVASRYFFAKQVIEIENKYEKTKHDISSFEAFLDERFIWGNQDFMWHRAIRGWYPCFDYVVDRHEKIRCDILRFEHLNEDLIRYFKLNSMDRARNVTAARSMTTSELYNDKTIQIVADWYKKDIETFGYDFAGGPTKNTFYED